MCTSSLSSQPASPATARVRNCRAGSCMQALGAPQADMLSLRCTSTATELTGITQDMVDGGVTLGQALDGCERWLSGLGVDITRPFPVTSPGDAPHAAHDAAVAAAARTGLIVTCGDWDMRHLAKEAKSKGLRPAPIFSTWINIKVRFLRLKRKLRTVCHAQRQMLLDMLLMRPEPGPLF